MKVRGIYYKRLLLGLLAVLGVLLLSGCEKRFYEYNWAWVSDDPYIYIPIDHSFYVEMEIDGVLYELTSAWANDASEIYFYNPQIDNGMTEESKVWSASCKIKDDKLYMTVEEDKISDYEGKTIVLHQQPLEETTDEETEE